MRTELFTKYFSSKNEEPNPITEIVICPSEGGLYSDLNGGLITPLTDTIEKKEFQWNRDGYSFVVPGILEWYERYRMAVLADSSEFDWKGWHRDGLLFAKQIYDNLPHKISVRYEIPKEDNSGLIESFEVSAEKIESLLASLGDSTQECEPVISDPIVVGVKEEDSEIHIRLKVKGKYDCYTFCMDYDTLKLMREFLEKVALNEQNTSVWESKSAENGIYFYPQAIGGFKHMGQLQIFSDRELVFSAYINSRQFIRSIYRSVMAHISTMNDNKVYRTFQSNILECYIDDERYKHISFFRSHAKYANIIEPAITNIRKYLRGIYDSIFDEEE